MNETYNSLMATVFILEPSTQHQPSSSSWGPDTRYFLCVATLTLLFFCRNWPRLLCHFKEEFWRHNQTVYIAAPSTQTRSSPAGGQVNIYISTISTYLLAIICYNEMRGSCYLSTVLSLAILQLGQPSVIPPGLVLEAGGTST